MELRLLREDARILAWEKPPGLDSAPRAPGETDEEGAPHAVMLAARRFPELRGITTAPHAGECGLLHRLDRGTGGLLLFARTQEAYDALREAWGTPAIEKSYRALVRPLTEGAAPPAPGTEIRIPIAHDAKSARKMRAIAERVSPKRHRGTPQEAWTRIERVQRIERGPATGAWELELRILTGARHQIRVHLAALGFPVLGDTLYRGAPLPEGLGIDGSAGFALWSAEVRISLPQHGFNDFSASSPPPWKKSD